jgi:hypothetical protein
MIRSPHEIWSRFTEIDSIAADVRQSGDARRSLARAS